MKVDISYLRVMHKKMTDMTISDEDLGKILECLRSLIFFFEENRECNAYLFRLRTELERYESYRDARKSRR